MSWGHHLVPSYDHLLSFPVSAGNSWALPKSFACQNIAGRPCEGSFSVVSGIFASRRQYEENKKMTDGLGKTTRLREFEAIAMPSCSHRIISTMKLRWDHGVGEDSRIWVAHALNTRVIVIWPYKRTASKHIPQSALKNSTILKFGASSREIQNSIFVWTSGVNVGTMWRRHYACTFSILHLIILYKTSHQKLI